MGNMATWTVSLGMRMLPRSGSRPLSPLLLSDRTSSRAGLSLRLRLPIARTPFTPSHLPPSSRPTVYPNGLEAASRPHEVPRPSHRRCMQAGEWGSWAPRKKQGDRGVASTASNWSGSPYASPSRGAVAVTNHTRRTPPTTGVSRRGWFILGSWPAWVLPVPRASMITSLRSHAAAMDETPSSATDVAKGKLPVNLRPLLPAIDPKESSSSSPSPLPSFSGLTKRLSPTTSACSSCRKRKAKVSVIPNSGADRLLKPWTKVQRTPARVQTMLPTYTRLPIRHG